MTAVNRDSVGTTSIKFLRRLTPEELATLKDDHLEILQEMTIKEEQLNAQKKRLQGEIKALKSEAKEKFILLRDKSVLEDHKVHLVPNYDDKKMEFWSVETSEKVGDRALSPSEQQLAIGTTVSLRNAHAS